MKFILCKHRYSELWFPRISLSLKKTFLAMNMQSAKLELIKMIADIQSEELLDKIRDKSMFGGGALEAKMVDFEFS